MIELLRFIVKIILSPMIHIPIMLIVTVWLVKINYKKLGAILLMITVSWYWIASTSPLSAKLAGSLEDQYPPANAEQILSYRPQVIVVLACYYYDNDLLPLVSRWPECSLKRLLHAYLLHRDTGVPIAVTGGPIEDTHASHTYAARDFLQALGVKSSDIVAINEGGNTQLEAQAIQRAGFKKITLVTTAIHMPRSVNEFKQLGIDVLASPTDHLSKINSISAFNWPNAVSLHTTQRVIYEYIGLIYQRVKYGSAIE